jgi:hypothetical protein
VILSFGKSSSKKQWWWSPFGRAKELNVFEYWKIVIDSATPNSPEEVTKARDLAKAELFESFLQISLDCANNILESNLNYRLEFPQSIPESWGTIMKKIITDTTNTSSFIVS